MKHLSFKLQPTLVAVSVALAISSASAEEVQTKKDETEVITVTGIRGSLSEALNKKRFSDQVVDSISAEDVGKFPDDNLAEALQRIAGVSMSRDETGSGDVVSIRGMGPDMNKVTMNGQSIASAGGVGNTGQGFSFGVLSADMISALEVWKSPKASQDAGAVGGTVNIKTKAPLEIDETKIFAGLEVGYQEVGSENTHKVNARIITQFFDDKFGLTFGFNQSSAPFRTDTAGVNSYVKPKGPNTMLDESGAAYDGSNHTDDGWDDGKPWMINAYKLQQRTANRDKAGADLTLQWRPTDALDIRLNGLYAEQIDNDHQENLMFRFNAGGRKSRNGVVDENGFVSEVVVTPKNGNQRDLQLQTWLRTQEKDTTALNFNIDWLVTDNSALKFAAGTSEGNRWMGQHFPVFFASGVLSYNQNTTANTSFPDLAFNGEEAVPEDSAFMLSQINNQIKQWQDTNDYIQLDYELDTGFDTFQQISVGVKRIETGSSQQVQKGKLIGNLGTMADYYSHTTPDTAYYQGTAWNNWSTASFSAIEDVWGDFDDIELGKKVHAQTGVVVNEGSPIENWQVDNDITALYIQADFDGELIWPVRGNFGVRYEKTEMTAHSMTQVGKEYTPFTATNDYSDVLPSLNMVFELQEDLLMRFSAAKVMSRAIARDLAPAYRLNTNGELFGQGGNPYLDPFRANQLDLGIEWYFNEGSLLSANYFKKDVESFIAKEVTKQLIEGEIYDISAPVNGGAADIQGLELTYEQPFTGLPGLLSDMGTQINYTYTDSSTEFYNTAFEREMPMEGLSENTVNATLYYEIENFSARVAYTYRDEYLYSGAGHSVTPLFLQASTYVDAQITYKLNKNFSFALKANNLTNQEMEYYLFEEQYPVTANTTGRNYRLSMTVRL